MNDNTSNLDQNGHSAPPLAWVAKKNGTSDCELDRTDEEILAPDVSDEALEAAADMAATLPTASMAIVPPNCC